MQEWKALSAMAVKWLGMPEEAVPFYSASALMQWKGRRILAFVLETGNFGHNKDMSYMKKYPYVIRKAISLWRHTWDFLRQFFVFPLDSMRAWGGDDKGRCWGGEEGEVRKVSFGGAGLFFVYIKNDLD